MPPYLVEHDNKESDKWSELPEQFAKLYKEIYLGMMVPSPMELW